MLSKETRLRYIRTSSIDDLVIAVASLPFRVELKGNPVKDDGKWVIFFVLPEIDGLEWSSVDLT